MHRFFIEKINPLDKYAFLKDSSQLHHLRDVLRIKQGEQVGLFDNSGNEYISSVFEINSGFIKLEVKEKKKFDDSGIKITVACAIPKKVKMDDIVDKLTQLGVERVIPLETERVIVKLDQEKKIKRLQRWEKIAVSAVKQSQRASLALVEKVTKFKDVILNTDSYDLKLIPTLEGERATLKRIFDHPVKKIKTVMVLIGPEGDFTPLEIAQAVEAGFVPVSLGAQVLRVDTAAIAVVSFIKLNEEC